MFPYPFSFVVSDHSWCAHLEGDLLRRFLRGGQRFNQLVVVQDVPLGIAEQEEDAVLDVLELFLHLGVRNDWKAFLTRHGRGRGKGVGDIASAPSS